MAMTPSGLCLMAIHIRRLRCVHSKIRHIPSSSICRITAKNGVVQHDVEQPHNYIYSLCNTLLVSLSHLIPYCIHALIRTHLFPLSLPPSISHTHSPSLTDDSNLTQSQTSLNESQTRLNGVLSLLNNAKIDTERATVRKIVADTLLSETETLLKQQQREHNTTMFPLMEQYQTYMNSVKLSEAYQAIIKKQLEEAWQNPDYIPDISILIGDIFRKLVAD